MRYLKADARRSAPQPRPAHSGCSAWRTKYHHFILCLAFKQAFHGIHTGSQEAFWRVRREDKEAAISEHIAPQTRHANPGRSSKESVTYSTLLSDQVAKILAPLL